jgi:protocatechuate 3,4-dioxygenase beta subunit
MRSISPLGALLVAGAVLALTAVALVYFFSGATSLGPESARPPGSTSTAPADPKADAALAAGVEQPKKNADVAVASPIVGESKPAAARAETQSEEPNNPEPAKLGFAKGRVLDFDGKPAAGVKIFILAKKGMSMAPADTETDAKGDFQVSENVKKKKTMRLRASRKDRLPIVVEDVAFKLAETTDVGILQFKPSGSLEVLVTDRDNHPVPGAQISLEFPNEKEEAIDESAASDPKRGLEVLSQLTRGVRATDEEGIARFPALTPGRIVVRAEPPAMDGFGGISGKGMRRRRGDPTPVEPQKGSAAPKTVDLAGAESMRLEMTLSNLGVLSGHAKIHGQPVAGDWLGLHQKSKAGSFLGKFTFHVRAKTEADGKFTFPPVPPGTYVVKKGDPGSPIRFDSLEDGDGGMEAAIQMASAMMKGNDAPGSDLGRVVEILEGTNRAELDFGGAMVEIFVQDADDATPVANATVRMFDYEKPKAPDPNETNARPKRSWEKMAEGFMPSDKASRAVRLKSQADGRGRVEFRDVEGGSYRIIARAEGRPPSDAVDLILNEGRVERAIVKIPRGTNIAGTVNDHAGNAIRRATVTSIFERETEPAYPDELLSMITRGLGPSAVSDEKGNFVLNALELGEHTLVASADGFAPAVLKARAPSEGSQFFLDKPGTIRVTVTRAGAPVKGVFVSIDTEADDAPLPPEVWMQLPMLQASFGSRMGNTNDQGVCQLKNIPPGEWSVVINDYKISSDGADADEAAKKINEDAAKILDEETKKAAESAEAKGTDPKAAQSKALGNVKSRLETYLKTKKARARVAPEQEASVRIELDR